MRKKKDLGKKNVKGKTGFAAVVSRATKQYGSMNIGKKIAGAVLKKLRKVGKV